MSMLLAQMRLRGEQCLHHILDMDVYSIGAMSVFGTLLVNKSSILLFPVFVCPWLMLSLLDKIKATLMRIRDEMTIQTYELMAIRKSMPIIGDDLVRQMQMTTHNTKGCGMALTFIHEEVGNMHISLRRFLDPASELLGHGRGSDGIRCHRYNPIDPKNFPPYIDPLSPSYHPDLPDLPSKDEDDDDDENNSMDDVE